MEELRLGVIGLGVRGFNMFDLTLDVENVKVTALCDWFDDRLKRADDHLLEKCGYRAELMTNDFNELIAFDKVDVVMVFAAWEAHIPAAIAAMKAKKPVAVEVAGAYTVDQCWELVKTYEETKTPIMMLENACYGRDELLVQNMKAMGAFGTIVHCNGAYRHDLREEIIGGGLVKGSQYRFRNYKHRNCENYPTHELGPIAQLLDINRGNRMLSLVSMSSKSAGLHDYIVKHHPDNEELMNTEFAQGDVVTTMIKCARGETITLTLDTSCPRFYSRDLKVIGTNASYEMATKTIFVDGEGYNHESSVTKEFNNVEKALDKYEHPIWKDYLKNGPKGGHGGLDWLVLSDFFDCLRAGKPMPIDVYDMAAWMVVTALSEKSISMGSAPVDIPDFTCGQWIFD